MTTGLSEPFRITTVRLRGPFGLASLPIIKQAAEKAGPCDLLVIDVHEAHLTFDDVLQFTDDFPHAHIRVVGRNEDDIGSFPTPTSIPGVQWDEIVVETTPRRL